MSVYYTTPAAHGKWAEEMPPSGGISFRCPQLYSGIVVPHGAHQLLVQQRGDLVGGALHPQAQHLQPVLLQIQQHLLVAVRLVGAGLGHLRVVGQILHHRPEVLRDVLTGEVFVLLQLHARIVLLQIIAVGEHHVL